MLHGILSGGKNLSAGDLQAQQQHHLSAGAARKVVRKGGFALRQRVTILTACRPGAAGCSETLQAHRGDFFLLYTKCCFTQLKPARCGQRRTVPHTGDTKTHMREAAFQHLMFRFNDLFCSKFPPPHTER